mgnify:CR=1 FL=1
MFGLHDVCDAALARLAVDADHRLVAAAEVGGVDREIRHFPYAVVLLQRETLLDRVLVRAGEGGEDEVAAVVAGRSTVFRPRRLVLATGAYEQPWPVPGWTLPGVMTVGAAQIALKTAGVVPDEMTWIAGQGPLLSLFAVQTLRAGGRLAGILDLSDTSKMWDGLRHLPAALANVGELAKGLGWMWQINRAGFKWIHAANIRAEGDGRLERIVFDSMGHTSREPATTLLLHDGIVPSVQITRALGLEHRWDEAQQCWHPAASEWGKSNRYLY